MTAQSLQKWLETAVDQASQDRTIDLHFADAGRALYLPGGNGAGENNLYSPYRQLFVHAPHARQARTATVSAESPIRYLAGPRRQRSTY